jgi:hypothetical protein
MATQSQITALSSEPSVLMGASSEGPVRSELDPHPAAMTSV